MKTRILFATVCLWFCVLDALSASQNQTSGMRSTNGFGWGITTLQSVVGKAATGNVTNESGSRVAYLGDVTASTNGLAPVAVGIKTNSSVLVNNLTNINFVSGANTTVTGLVSGASVTIGISASSADPVTDGSGITNIQCTNIVLALKAPFSTNYTVSLVDQVLACTGTNQILTLPNGTNGVMSGTIFSFLMSSTTGYGSAVVTNANGVQTVLTAEGLSQTITNGQSLTLLWDGVNWR